MNWEPQFVISDFNMVSLIENKTLQNLASSISGISFYWRLGSLQFWWLPWIYSSSPPVIITTTESPCGWSAGCSFDSCSPQGWWSWLVAALPGGDWQVMLCMRILLHVLLSWEVTALLGRSVTRSCIQWTISQMHCHWSN